MDLFYTANRDMLLADASQIALGVSERSICADLKAKLEPLLARFGFAGYYADVEYNRGEGGLVKAISVDGCHPETIVCDLIIHSGGEKIRDNLLCLEMKKRDGAGIESDKRRLRILTSDSDRVYTIEFSGNRHLVADYLVGVYYEYDRESKTVYFEYYSNGRLNHSETMGFDEMMTYRSRST